MKKVQFSDGSYGVRSHWFFGWHYVDLVERKYRWKAGDLYFYRCMGAEKEADLIILHLTGKHKVCRGTK